jgi:putative oxidoreductase
VALGLNPLYTIAAVVCAAVPLSKRSSECQLLNPGGHKMDHATPLFFPQIGPLYDALFPWAEMLLRAVVGLTLVPHGLRSAFGMFPTTGGQSHNLTEFADELERDGYHPGKFWAPAIVLTQIVAGPMLAVGLFTRLTACPIVIFLIVTNYERWRVGGFFWNKMGLEFTLLWAVSAFYFLVNGGGAISIDHIVVGRQF